MPRRALHLLLVPQMSPTRLNAVFAVCVKVVGAVMIMQCKTCRRDWIWPLARIYRLNHPVRTKGAGTATLPSRELTVALVVATGAGTAGIATGITSGGTTGGTTGIAARAAAAILPAERGS